MSDEAAIPSAHEPVEPTDTSTQLAPVLSNPQASLSPKSFASRSWLANVRRPRTSPGPRASALKRTPHGDDDDRRDSARASSNGTTITEPPSPRSLRKTPSLPAIVVHSESSSSKPDDTQADDGASFSGIDCIIPTGSFDEISSDALISFSKRGSIMLGGKRANRKSRQLDLLVPGVSTASAPPRQEGQEQLQSEEQEQPGEQTQPPQSHAQDQQQEQDKEQEQSPSDQMQREQQQPQPPARHLSPRKTSRVSVRTRSASQRVLSTDEMTLSRKLR